MTLGELENIEDVVDCKIILIERMTASDNESIYYGIENASGKSVTPNIKCDNEVNKNDNSIESLIDLTGDDSDVDDDAECCTTIQDKVKDEQHNICKMDDTPNESSNTSAAITSIESPREQENSETPVRMDDNSNLKSEEHIISGNNCSEHFDKKRSSVNDVLKQKYAGMDVIDIEDSDDESDTESYQNSSLAYVTEKDNDALNDRDNSIEILSDSEHPSEEEETEVMFIKTTQPKHKIDQGITKQQSERLFKRRRQESRAAFAKVSSQTKVSHTRVKYSIPYNETQRAAKLNDDEERQQKKISASNERFQFHESAFEEQERLFRESAARVKAQEIAQQRYLQSVERIQFFSKPADVSSLPSNHWKWSDPFSRLGVPKDCPVEIARRNYKKLCLIYHPDKAKSDSSLQFQAIKEAWESISSSTR